MSQIDDIFNGIDLDSESISQDQANKLLLNSIKIIGKKVERIETNHDKRISTLESWKLYVIGFAGGISFLFTILWHFIKSKIG